MHLDSQLEARISANPSCLNLLEIFVHLDSQLEARASTRVPANPVCLNLSEVFVDQDAQLFFYKNANTVDQ